MAEPMMMNGATDSPLSLLSPEAREGMMRPSEEIKAVLLARLGNMAPEELSMLDQASCQSCVRLLSKLVLRKVLQSRRLLCRMVSRWVL